MGILKQTFLFNNTYQNVSYHFQNIILNKNLWNQVEMTIFLQLINIINGFLIHVGVKYEVLLYTWKYQHALKLKLVHYDIKDGTICVLQMIRTPQECRKGRGLNESVS